MRAKLAVAFTASLTCAIVAGGAPSLQVVGIGPADTVRADPSQPFWVQLPP